MHAHTDLSDTGLFTSSPSPSLFNVSQPLFALLPLASIHYSTLFKPHATKQTICCSIIQTTYNQTDHLLFHHTNHTQQTIHCSIIQTTHNLTDHLLFHYSNHTQPNRPSAVPLFKPHTTKQTICYTLLFHYSREIKFVPVLQKQYSFTHHTQYIAKKYMH